MRNIALAWLMVALAEVVTGTAWAAEDVRIVETRAVPTAPGAGASHLLRLHVYTFRGTRWGTGEVLGSTLDAVKLLAQCGIAAGATELNVLDAPERFHYYATPVSRELMRRLDARKPAIFFVEDTRNQPAFDAEAIGRANSRTRPELADTVWVAYGARDLPQALAHELVHLLANSGEHSALPGNLMRDETSSENVKLTEAQCAGVRSAGVANGLLDPR